MVQLLADWQGPTPCCGLLTCWSAAGSAWQCCLSYACTNKPERVSDHLRADLRQTDNDFLGYAKWGLRTRANAIRGHCIHNRSYRVHQLYHRLTTASKIRRQSQGMIQPAERLQVLVLMIQRCICKDSAAAAAEGEKKTAVRPTWWEEALPAWHQNFEGQAFAQHPSPPFVSAPDRQPAQLPPMAPSWKLEVGESMVRALSENGPAAVLPNCQPARCGETLLSAVCGASMCCCDPETRSSHDMSIGSGWQSCHVMPMLVKALSCSPLQFMYW